MYGESLLDPHHEKPPPLLAQPLHLRPQHHNHHLFFPAKLRYAPFILVLKEDAGGEKAVAGRIKGERRERKRRERDNLRLSVLMRATMVVW